jgi:hypothetical protein
MFLYFLLIRTSTKNVSSLKALSPSEKRVLQPGRTGLAVNLDGVSVRRGPHREYACSPTHPVSLCPFLDPLCPGLSNFLRLGDFARSFLVRKWRAVCLRALRFLASKHTNWNWRWRMFGERKYQFKLTLKVAEVFIGVLHLLRRVRYGNRRTRMTQTIQNNREWRAETA